MRSAASILQRQFGAKGTASEFEDRAQELASLVLAEDEAREVSTFARDGMLTTREAAEYCGRSKKTLEKYREVGTGPAFYRDGDGPRSRVFYKPSDLDAWMQETISRKEAAAA